MENDLTDENQTGNPRSRVRQIFEDALDQPTQLRRPFLITACAGDQQLLETVDELLRARESSAGILDTPVHERRQWEPVAREPGSRIGPYKLLKELPGGGMGVVYQAVRADEVFRRVCAVKVIRAEVAAGWLVESFRQERQMLATLDHMHIARIIDGGSTPEGLPYFVMDYVDGPPIHTFCTEHALNTRQRLVLYLQACAAVGYLHQNRVTHGDLKPPNILVGADGMVKLVDFGIATALSSSASSTVHDENKALPLMTPGYASPEQMRGDALSTASDVYSLGVILYELLTGTRPYAARNHSLSDLMSAIATEDPLPPSVVVGSASPATSHASAVRTLKGDLDSIVLQAMQRDPRDRYASAGKLAEDIERYLADRVVVAHKRNHFYQGWKFVRRHQAATAAAFIIALLVSALGWQAVRFYQSQRTVARLEQEIRNLQEQMKQAINEANAQAPHAQGKSMASELLRSPHGNTAKLRDAYRFTFPEAVRIRPGMTRGRRELLDGAAYDLRQAEPLVGKDPRGAEQLAAAWLWLANLEGNPRVVNLHDPQAAAGSIKEAKRLLQRIPQAPSDLATQVEDAERDIQSTVN